MEGNEGRRVHLVVQLVLENIRICFNKLFDGLHY